MTAKINKSEQEWRRQLSVDQYRITRLKGTERPYSGEYWDCRQAGVYVCVCCEQPLFDSDAKFDSGTGWPSFTRPVDPEVILTRTDYSMLMVRTEALCSHCEAHLGHVFPDGPPPFGQRFCINSVALRLVGRESGED